MQNKLIMKANSVYEQPNSRMNLPSISTANANTPKLKYNFLIELRRKSYQNLFHHLEEHSLSSFSPSSPSVEAHHLAAIINNFCLKL